MSRPTMPPDVDWLPRWLIRWGPILPAVGVFGGSLWVFTTATAPSIRHVSLLISALIWLLVAIGVALGPAWRLLATRAAGRPRTALLLFALACCSAGAIVYLSPASTRVPVLMALLHGSLSASRPLVRCLTWIFIPGMTLLLTDSALVLFRNSPTLIQAPAVLRVVRPLYQTDWNVIQFMPGCAQYHDALTYTLRPGQCTFDQTEFQTTYDINSLGVRDDEDSLVAPVVVVSGDSVAMGWGVEEDEAFPTQVQVLTGLKVLNTGIASYGTAREMALLQYVDRSALRHLVVQYHDNDYGENRVLARTKKTPLRSPAWYRWQQEYVVSQQIYRPGKYLYETYRREIESWLSRRHRQSLPPEEPANTAAKTRSLLSDKVYLFLQALAKAPVGLESVNLLIYLGGFDQGQRADFAREIYRQLPTSGLPAQFAGIHVADPSLSFSPKHRFLLDSHPNAAGHEKIARVLAGHILKLERRHSQHDGS